MIDFVDKMVIIAFRPVDKNNGIPTRAIIKLQGLYKDSSTMFDDMTKDFEKRYGREWVEAPREEWKQFKRDYYNDHTELIERLKLTLDTDGWYCMEWSHCSSSTYDMKWTADEIQKVKDQIQQIVGNIQLEFRG